MSKSTTELSRSGSVGLSRSRTETVLQQRINPKTQVMIYAAALVHAGEVKLSDGTEGLIKKLQEVGCSKSDCDFLEGKSEKDVEQLIKDNVPQALLFNKDPLNPSATTTLASFLKDEIERIKDSSNPIEQANNKNGIRQIVNFILKSPEREGFLLYMQGYLGKDKFCDFLSLCMNSQSLKSMNISLADVNRFEEIKKNPVAYKALTELLRKDPAKIGKALEADLKSGNYDSTDTEPNNPKGVLEHLMVSPKSVAGQIVTRMASDDLAVWSKDASGQFEKILSEFNPKDLNKISPDDSRKFNKNDIDQMRQNYINKYIVKERRKAIIEDQKVTRKIYKELYGQYVSNENKAAFNEAFDTNRFSALKYIRADRRFNPFMYARVFVDGLAQEYIHAVDKLSPGQLGQSSTTGGKIAKGFITAFRTVIALPLRLLADPAGFVQSIGTSITKVTAPLTKRYRQWKDKRTKSKWGAYEKASDALDQFKELFKNNDKINGRLGGDTVKNLASFLKNNMENLINAGLINASDKALDPTIKKKIAWINGGRNVDFSATDIASIFKHMNANVSKIQRDFASDKLQAAEPLQKLLGAVDKPEMQKALMAVEANVGIPSLDVTKLNPSNIEQTLESARSPRSPSSDTQSSPSGSGSSTRDNEETLSTHSSGSMANMLADLTSHPKHQAPPIEHEESYATEVEQDPESMASMVEGDEPTVNPAPSKAEQLQNPDDSSAEESEDDEEEGNGIHL